MEGNIPSTLLVWGPVPW